jgi:hypothetical protein
MLLAIGSLLALFTLMAGEPPKAGKLLYADDFRAGLSRWARNSKNPAS